MSVGTDVTAGQRGNAVAVVALALLAVLAWLVAWYWPTASQIFGIWQRSDTFAHGMIVLPMFAWLFWRKRDVVALHRPQPWPLMAVPVAALGFAWMLGRMVNVDGLTHFALIGMVVFGFAGILGRKLSRVLLFPLLFLWFALPIGEFLLPVLMHYTAEFTVFALRLTGVPVYQEGLYFIIPNGRWSVVEACSGLRYMIASLFVGALYAYLNYVSLKRRLLFMLVALVVPIVANWLRAYLTVMIGYHFGNEFVQGFIHIVYGWVFFGVVILLMFLIGSLWREDEVVRRSPEAPLVSAPVGGGPWLRVLPFALVTAAFPLLLERIEAPVEAFSVEIAVPAAAPGWRAVEESVHDFLPNYSGHRGERFQAYRRESDGAVVGLYIAYYASQHEDYELVAWQNRLVGREDAGRWLQTSTRRDSLPVGPAVAATLRRNDDQRMALWHWYWTNHRVIASDVMAKVILAVDHLTMQTDDAAFVAVYAPYIDEVAEVRPLIEAFVADHKQAIEAALLNAEMAGG